MTVYSSSRPSLTQFTLEPRCYTQSTRACGARAVSRCKQRQPHFGTLLKSGRQGGPRPGCNHAQLRAADPSWNNAGDEEEEEHEEEEEDEDEETAVEPGNTVSNLPHW